MMQQSLEFKLSNELTFDTVESDYKRLLKAIQDNDTKNFCLDLQHVTECDSAGLALLIEAKRLCKQYDKSLLIHGMSKDIYALAKFGGVEVMINDKQ
ncbi:STAS domain-containing protein [Legionella oakridgensis]|uniref:Putative NTP binding protein n=2 Tax=Legionella oakridgensis TaxID=29423 RepID=W0BA96_9GAMM|nr:STAS domain-containing protein [Legionella oakridgensis]AHE67458.1 putative NTP binding protein [Legionella oakridgensis ATCC 33761 = DSM 21215]ETO92987.1 putative NTP binding protein [Legionella oakridgensis RV-2-2007]KTD43515.1 putative anti-sigma-B factor antagonist (Anti-anti-sigma-B factor) [Legionella oakridgensis]STY20507.1 putative anti-sigma-B factor antagonist (Anti-anti-sigma-B factor) [Legionella longbeachae]